MVVVGEVAVADGAVAVVTGATVDTVEVAVVS